MMIKIHIVLYMHGTETNMNFMMIKNEINFMNVKDWQITYNYKEILCKSPKTDIKILPLNE